MKYKKVDKKKAQCKLYGNIGDWMTNGETFTQMLEELSNSGFTELEFREHCYGGSVFEGNVMMNATKSSELDISVLVEGLAASMGFLWLLSIPKEKVTICENAFGMIHRPSSVTIGDADDHLSSSNLMKSMEVNMIKEISERSGISEVDVKAKWFDGKDHWLNADEMVKYGFAGKKVKPVAASIKSLDKQAVENSTPENIYARFAAVLDKNNNKNNSNFKKMDLALLIATFALEGVTAESTDAAVLAALQTKFKGLSEKVDNLERDAKAKSDAAVTAVLDGADQAGKFDNVPGKTKEQARAFYKELGEKSGVEVLNVVVAGLQGSGSGRKPNIMQAIVGGKVGIQSAANVAQNWDWYQQNNPEALQAMADESHPDHDTFRELYKSEFKVYPQ